MLPDSPVGAEYVSRLAGAPATEIEITPEMIEAGMVEYNKRWCGLADADDDTAREMLRASYLAMRRLLPSPGYQ